MDRGPVAMAFRRPCSRGRCGSSTPASPRLVTAALARSVCAPSVARIRARQHKLDRGSQAHGACLEEPAEVRGVVGDDLAVVGRSAASGVPINSNSACGTAMMKTSTAPFSTTCAISRMKRSTAPSTTRPPFAKAMNSRWAIGRSSVLLNASVARNGLSGEKPGKPG